ncbi:MAG: hypothetical protein KBE09_03260 [Candidatus Pacebacteria bacterium]|nr:hypothetical protein [Candidatus Paceibacterota bacterium]
MHILSRLSYVLLVSLFVSIPLAAPASVAAAEVCTPYSAVYTSAPGMPIQEGGSSVNTLTSGIWATPFSGSSWIWSHALVADPNNLETKTFLLQFPLPAAPTSTILSVAADDYFKIYVNSIQLANEQGEGNFLASNIKTYNSFGPFSAGTNTIAFEVSNAPYFFAGDGTSENNPAGLLFTFSVAGQSCVTVEDENEETPPTSGGSGGSGGGGGGAGNGPIVGSFGGFTAPSVPAPVVVPPGNGPVSTPAAVGAPAPAGTPVVDGGSVTQLPPVSSVPGARLGKVAGVSIAQAAEIMDVPTTTPVTPHTDSWFNARCFLLAALLLAALLLAWSALSRYMMKESDVATYRRNRILFTAGVATAIMFGLWYFGELCALPYFFAGAALILIWDIVRYLSTRSQTSA